MLISGQGFGLIYCGLTCLGLGPFQLYIRPWLMNEKELILKLENIALQASLHGSPAAGAGPVAGGSSSMLLKPQSSATSFAPFSFASSQPHEDFNYLAMAEQLPLERLSPAHG